MTGTRDPIYDGLKALSKLRKGNPDMKYSIVGTNFCGAEAAALLKTTTPGTPIDLVREPTNEFDPNAVAVYIGDQKVGYIARKLNVTLSKFIDDNGEAWPRGMTFDEKNPPKRATAGTFYLSPNSSFPQVEIGS